MPDREFQKWIAVIIASANLLNEFDSDTLGTYDFHHRPNPC